MTPLVDRADPSTYTRPWWTVAAAVMRAGWDVVVLDPDAGQVEVLFDGNPSHGTITVTPCCAQGWTVIVTECEPDAEDE